MVDALEERRLLAAADVHLVWEQQPGATQAEQAVSPPIRVAFVNSKGTVLSDDHAVVTLRLDVGNRVTRTVATQQARNGLAVFHNVKIRLAGTYRLEAVSPHTGAVASASFSIYSGPAERMYLDKFQWSGIGHGFEAWAFDLRLVDKFGNVALNDMSAITVHKATGYGPETPPPYFNILGEPEALNVTDGHVSQIVVASGFHPLRVLFVDSNPRVHPVASPLFNPDD